MHWFRRLFQKSRTEKHLNKDLRFHLEQSSIGFSKLNSPAHRYFCLRFERRLTTSPARLEARMDSLLSFL